MNIHRDIFLVEKLKHDLLQDFIQLLEIEESTIQEREELHYDKQLIKTI